MDRGLGIIIAILIHGFFILFGGIFFFKEKKEAPKVVKEVNLVSEEEEKKEKPVEEKVKVEEEIKSETEQLPDLRELAKLDAPSLNVEPALEALSLSALESALNPGGVGGGMFGGSAQLTSGGRIGGTGVPGFQGKDLDQVFSMNDLDQKPRTIFQSPPIYPAELRGAKVTGMVFIFFIVDPKGKVMNAKVEKSSNPAFEKPALDAVKQWKFEPAVRGGNKVSCKMRVPIRFNPS